MRFRTKVTIACLAGFAAAYYWFMIEAGTDGIKPQAIDISRLRKEAQAIPGAKPESIEFVAPAVRRVPGTLLVAGGGLAPDLIADIAFRLHAPGGDTVIDSGMSETQAKGGGYRLYFRQAQAQIDAWMRDAAHIVFTHEHPGHIGGFVASPDFGSIVGKAVLSPVERAAVAELRPADINRLPRAVDTDYAPIAPGVVTLATPGHTPGSQMVFVQMQSGREYLFAGDTAAMARNVEWQRPRSRLLGQWRSKSEDRAATIAWLKGLVDLHRREPRLTIIYGHDLNKIVSPQSGLSMVNAYDASLSDANRRPDNADMHR